MSFKASQEIVVHFENMRNIDLFHQGVYMLKAYIYQQNESGLRNYAQPYNHHSIEKKLNQKVKEKYRSEAHTFDYVFYSKAFTIRYQDEEIDLDDICHFRIEIDAFPYFDEDNLYFVVDLLYADISQLTSEKPLKFDGPETGFKYESQFISKLHNLYGGICEYVPILFDDMHFCLVNSTINTIIVDFKFKHQADYQQLQHQQLKEESKTQQQSQQQQQNSNGKQQQQKPLATNFKDYFEIITENFNKEIVDKFYLTYVRGLQYNYEQFIKKYLRYVELLSKPQDKYKWIQQIQSLSLASTILNQNQNQLNDTSSQISEKSTASTQSSSKSLQQVNESEDEKIADERDRKQMDKQQLLDDQQQQQDQKNLKISEMFDYSTPENQQKLIEIILKEINNIAASNFQLWYIYIDLLKSNLKKVKSILEQEYNQKIKDRWGESIFSFTIKTKDLTIFEELQIGRKNTKIAEEMRKKHSYMNIEPLNVEDMNLFPKVDLQPFLFEEIYTKDDKVDAVKSPLKKNQEGAHLFIFCHGYQGNSFDMRLMKDNLSLRYPNALVLSSTANEDNTDGDIGQMGKRLADEVKKFIREWCPGKECSKISFIGHSLGGVIIRASFEYLQDISDKFYTFLSFSSPHIGFMYHSSKLVDTGLWFMKTWKKCECLKQLTLSDSKEIQDSFIYKLAFKPGMNCFKNIVFVSSYQDQYVPFYSSRIQKNPKADANDNKAKLYNDMVESILSNLKTNKVHRIDVSFEIPEKSLDKMIGRAAHIQFLENQALMKMFFYTFQNFFQ